MPTELNLQAIYIEEKQRWLQSEVPKRTAKDWLALSVPWWIVVVGAAQYLLSTPHTAGIYRSFATFVHAGCSIHYPDPARPRSLSGLSTRQGALSAAWLQH
jgi:hypothetical protein